MKNRGQVVLKLYVSDMNGRAQLALQNLETICSQCFPGKYKIETVDLSKNPECAESGDILATPTVIKELPPPVRRVIGDLSDREKVLVGLCLTNNDNTSE